MFKKIRPAAVVIKTVDDPLFGSLKYIISDANSTCRFDKNKNVCTYPLQDADIHLDGRVFTCCQDWNPCSIGNTQSDDIKTIWSSEKAVTLRNSILDGSYRYCNTSTCPIMMSKTHPRLLTKEAAENVNYSLPRNIALTIDSSCNLACPSCRSQRMIYQTIEANERARNILQSLMDTIFSEPHSAPINLTMDGSGEVFFSSVYREFFENAKIFKTPELWPNLGIVLCTNGVMMTEKNQKKYNNLFNLTRYLRISVDAGNKESYDKVRKGGDWDILWENIDYWYNNRKNNSQWAWNLVVQDDNFKSIPELIRLAYRYPDNLPEIYIVNILNWGVCTEEEFDKKAVWSPASPQYQQLREILFSSEVQDYPKLFQHSV